MNTRRCSPATSISQGSSAAPGGWDCPYWYPPTSVRTTTTLPTEQALRATPGFAMLKPHLQHARAGQCQPPDGGVELRGILGGIRTGERRHRGYDLDRTRGIS